METYRSAQQDTTRATHPAFDLWLRRDLTDTFGSTLREPIPSEMLAMIEAFATSR